MPGARLVVEADGGSRGNPGPAGYGALVRDPTTGRVLAERAEYLGVVSNNVAEYSGLVAGLRAAVEIDPDAVIEVRLDSRLVVEQMSGRWKIKHEDMRRLAAQARAIVSPQQVSYTWVPRAENSAADVLANAAMDRRQTIVRNYDAAGAAAAATAELADAEPADAEPVGSAPAAVPGVRAVVPERVASGAPIRFDDAQPVTVVLVRHGETPLTVSKAYSGSSVPGPPLTEHGREQAARAAELVYRIGRDMWGDVPDPSELIASPMVRTQETAQVFAQRLGLPVRTEPLFAECDFGAWEGLTAAEIEQGWPGQLKRWHDDATFRAPGGESIEDVGARMRTGLQAVRAAGVGRTVVVVTHSVSVRSAVGVAIAANSSAWARIRVAPASVSIIRLWADGTSEVTVVGAPSGA
ncbi:bifunctional RNase H/acid phosphatase [Pengzhenrongella frigida]|uniref:Bifunctional RNase H/acid phosphatase n=1 Tax=Pengzhenrongella frigida TaxID=1259133 RepID=A0A4Q5N6L0_9MICO|nr:bifunctional RNase H/acid phosphatase [Cellulomonas sp. HLT2-17]RYV52607.1 bifunctional RNase H/acid phosphatase [Cellulomonas sp. HLT2-17]